jgi:hypothetical protein
MTSFLKKYACLCGGADFTPDEQAEIGRFAANLMKLASEGDQQGIGRLFHSEFRDMDEETLDRVGGYFEFLSIYDNGAGHSKTAFSLSSVPVASVLAGLAVAFSASDPVERLIGKITRGQALKSSLKSVLQRHPELRKDPNVPEYFQAVADFAPIVAKNPLIAGNILMQMHRVGPSHVTPQLIETLVGIQKDVPTGGSGLSTMADPTAALGESVRKHKEYLAEEPGYYRKQSFWSSEPKD